MGQPVDLRNLREMTDGDRELEKDLFDEFISCSGTMIQELHEACIQQNKVEWHEKTHAFKGIAYNLGAMHLGDLCKKGQESDDADIKTKALLLDEIIKEFDQVKAQLQKEVA